MADTKQKIVYQETSIGSSVKTNKLEAGEVTTGIFVGPGNHSCTTPFGMFTGSPTEELAISPSVVTPEFRRPSRERFRALQNAYARFNALETKVTKIAKILKAFTSGSEDYKIVSYETRDEVYKKIAKDYK